MLAGTHGCASQSRFLEFAATSLALFTTRTGDHLEAIVWYGTRCHRYGLQSWFPKYPSNLRGLRIYCENTKAMKIGPEQHAPILIMQQNMDYVEKFPYIGSYMSSDGDSEPDVRLLQPRPGSESCIHFQTASTYMVINYNQLECKVTSVHSNCDPHGNVCVWDVEENGHDRSQVRCLPSPLPTCNPRHLVERPCHKWRGDAESRHGATPRHCYNKEKENGWPRSQTVDRKTNPYSYVLGARRRKKKAGRPKKTWRYIQKRPERAGCQLAWGLPDRQWPWWMEASHRPMLREKQMDVSYK